ncbi:hypothetical protein CS063_13240 [Sporanaerobium hydrogeniformans]|uniref:Uncharacterized protein n=1 Tax=Sporanaerobium hydrogeniformans TaxID=3072179 RepID=A0AC61DAA6_9FIRM|nr:hypothetical protein [Sporanaerobium hydrogeniformans]PHV69942.1 hypothetical protein CS063_13240 [Sporanaerobium hydrogeniformans]
MNLYFGNVASIFSTILIAITLSYIVLTTANRTKIIYWGRRIGTLAGLGLLVCCFVATRDGYDLSVQASFNDNIVAGLFTLNSIQSKICCIGGGVIALSSFSSIFIKNQKYREVIFYILATAIIVKTFIIEISRWVM